MQILIPTSKHSVPIGKHPIAVYPIYENISSQQTFSNKRRPHTGDEANDQDCDDRSHESGVRLFGSWQAWVGAEVELFDLQERVFTVGVLEEGVEGDALFHPREGDSKLGVLFKGLEDLSE